MRHLLLADIGLFSRMKLNLLEVKLLFAQQITSAMLSFISKKDIIYKMICGSVLLAMIWLQQCSTSKVRFCLLFVKFPGVTFSLMKSCLCKVNQTLWWIVSFFKNKFAI